MMGMYLPKISKYLKKRKSKHSGAENIRTEYGYFILDTKKGIKGKGAHGPKSQTAGAYTSFQSMNHALEYCYSSLDGLLVHCRVPPSRMLLVPIYTPG